METGTARVAVQSGDGLVARFEDTAMVLGGRATQDEPLVEELMAALQAGAAEAPLPGLALARRIGEVVFRAGSGAVASLGVVSGVEGGALVLLRGRVDASIDGPSGQQQLSGDAAVTWVDHVVTAPFDRLWLRRSDTEPARVDPRSDLRTGVVPGAGFVLAPAGAVAEATPAPGGDGGEGEGGRASVGARPVTGPPALQPEDSRLGRPGPRAASTIAGTPAADELVGADGSRTPIDRAYVLGRDPTVDEAVRSGRASSLHVDDPDELVSRVHARVWVDRGVVLVGDGPSANGTFVAPPGAEDWTLIGPEGTELPLGWSLRIGGQIFTREPAERPGASE